MHRILSISTCSPVSKAIRLFKTPTDQLPRLLDLQEWKHPQVEHQALREDRCRLPTCKHRRGRTDNGGKIPAAMLAESGKSSVMRQKQQAVQNARAAMSSVNSPSTPIDGCHL